jgi:3-oxoadipate CoA-transferase, beta subunit
VNEHQRQSIAKRIASNIAEGTFVNLGIGIPTLVAGHVGDREITFHSENGVLGIGSSPPADSVDPELIDASKAPISVIPGASYFSHAQSFAMIRGHHIDLAVMGAFQVSSRGDLANWSTGDSDVPAVGGAMDLAVGAKDVWVAMGHTTRWGSKLVETCQYPLTARGVVKRIYTELATLEPRNGVFVVHETFGVTVEDLRRLSPEVRLVTREEAPEHNRSDHPHRVSPR